MKSRSTSVLFSGLFLWGLACYSCTQGEKTGVNEQDKIETPEIEVILKDHGAQPVVLNIETYTMSNHDFRMTLWTGPYLQLTLMSLPLGGEVGLEQHTDTDQFLRVEAGNAKVIMGDREDALTFTEEAGRDFAIIIPAGKWHNIINTGSEPLKLYSIYAPAHHPKGTVHKTFKAAREAEH